MLRPRHTSLLFLAAAASLILESATSLGCQEAFSCDGGLSNVTYSNISSSASCCPDADSCLGAFKYQNSSSLQDGDGRVQNTLTSTAPQGTMDLLKSRRLANRKFRLDADGIRSALPSDDVFSGHRLASGGRRPPVVVYDHVAANLSWTNQTGVDAGAWNITAWNLTDVDAGAWNITAWNLTDVDAGAWNISAGNLTAAGLAACDLSMTHLTHGERTSAHDLV